MHCFFITKAKLITKVSIILAAAADTGGEGEGDKKTKSGDDENGGKTSEVGGPGFRDGINAGGAGRTVYSVVKEHVEVWGVAETRAAELSLEE